MESFPTCYILLLFLLSHGVYSQKKNVLLIVVDDMRPQLGGVYDEGVSMVTPNINSLADDSLVMTKAYTQMAMCAPSRASFLTSRRPDTTTVYGGSDAFNASAGQLTTMPEYFMAQGYEVVGGGKIFHTASDNDASYWSQTFYTAPNREYWNLNSQYSWYEVPVAEQSAKPLPDEQVTNWATGKLSDLAADAISGVTPFFMAVGYRKPHLPFVCPNEFFDLYPEANITIAANPNPPVNMPAVAWYRNIEIKGYDDIAALPYTGKWQDDMLWENVSIDLRRAYYSCVSYVDDQVGTLLTQLTDLGLTDNTIVALIGDHGFQLGDSGEWAKFTNFERAVRVPFMVRIPGTTDGGVTSDELVELVDLFPTLAEASGQPTLTDCPEDPTASDDIALCTEGTSLVSLANGSYSVWKEYAFSQWQSSSSSPMGYTIRSARYRYTEWGGTQINSELYDYTDDPNETTNVSTDSAYRKIRRRLRAALHAGWYNAKP